VCACSGCLHADGCLGAADSVGVRAASALKENDVSHTSIAILQFNAMMRRMSRWSDERVGVPHISTAPLSFPDRLTGRRVSLVIVFADGVLQSLKQLRAQIKCPLRLIKCQRSFSAHHRRQQALPPLGCVVAECSPCGRVRLMLPCVALACQRLATAPADTHMAHMSWSWAEVVMERVTRGRVKKVQVRPGCSGARAVPCDTLVAPLLVCAVCLTRAAANAG
jgi:hypothetical protein